MIVLVYNFSKKQCVLPEDDRVIETCRSVLRVLTSILNFLNNIHAVPVAARSKAWFCGRSPAEIVGSNLAGGMDVCLL